MLLLVGAVALLRAPVYLYFSDPSIVPWSMGTGGFEKYVCLGFNISNFDALASGTGLTHQLVPSAWAGGPSASQLNARHEESGNNGDGSVPAGQLFRPSPPLCPHPCRSFNLDARIIRRLRIIKRPSISHPPGLKHPSISHPPWPKARKKTGKVLRTGRLP